MDQARLLQLLFGLLSLPKANSIRILPAWLGRERESVTKWAISKLRPHEPCPLVHYHVLLYGKVLFGSAQCLCIFWNLELSTIREQKMYCVYGNSSWYIHIHMVVRNTKEEVRYWEGPLSEVPLFF